MRINKFRKLKMALSKKGFKSSVATNKTDPKLGRCVKLTAKKKGITIKLNIIENFEPYIDLIANKIFMAFDNQLKVRKEEYEKLKQARIEKALLKFQRDEAKKKAREDELAKLKEEDDVE